MHVCFLLKRTSGHLNSKGFLRVFLMTRATKKRTSYHEFENKFNEHNHVEYKQGFKNDL